MTTNVHVIEINQSAFGIVVPEDSQHVRFFSAGALYDRLDGQIFRCERDVLAAARALSRPRRLRRENPSAR